MQQSRVVIIGAGISGLSAAYFLKKTAPEIEFVVLEGSGKAGGVISSLEKGGALMELGPEAFISIKPEVLNLADELGISNRLQNTNSNYSCSRVAHKGKMIEIPEGFVLFAPSKIKPWLTTKLFSFAGKARMALDLVLPRKKHHMDESVAAFVKRRLGKEALERLAQPLISSIYGADIYRLSSASVMPQMVQLEKNKRSIILGLLSRKLQNRQANTKNRFSMFMSFDRGMGVLIEALLKALPQNSVQCNKVVSALSLRDEKWFVSCSDGSQYVADAVVICTPSCIAAELLEQVDEELADHLKQIAAPKAMTVNLLFEDSAIQEDLDAFGFVVSDQDDSGIRACTFASSKFPGRAGNNTKLLRVFLRDQFIKRIWDKTDYEVTSVVTNSLRRYVRITGLPKEFHVARHGNGIPEYTIGHNDRLENISIRLRRILNLQLAGNSYRGIGISECIASAKHAALAVATYCRTSKTPREEAVMNASS